MALARRSRDLGMNYWPGFVDALSTLLLGIIFLLTVFVVVQFYLTQEMSGKDTALTRLNAQIEQLTELLSLEKSGKVSVEEELAQLRSNLSATEGERDRYKGLFEGAAGASDAKGKVTAPTGSPPRCSISTGKSRARSPGCCGSTATPTCARSTARNSSRTGISRRRARSRSYNTWSAKASRRSGWWPPASENFSRSIPTAPRKLTAATDASS